MSDDHAIQQYCLHAATGKLLLRYGADPHQSWGLWSDAEMPFYVQKAIEQTSGLQLVAHDRVHHYQMSIIHMAVATLQVEAAV